jgi:hypothetical protein
LTGGNKHGVRKRSAEFEKPIIDVVKKGIILIAILDNCSFHLVCIF